jgi:hypothetical protein
VASAGRTGKDGGAFKADGTGAGGSYGAVWALTSGAHHFKTNSNLFKHDLMKKWAFRAQKSQLKYWEKVFEMKKSFHFWNISENSTDFDLKFRFLFNLNFQEVGYLVGLCSVA